VQTVSDVKKYLFARYCISAFIIIIIIIIIVNFTALTLLKPAMSGRFIVIKGELFIFIHQNGKEEK